MSTQHFVLKITTLIYLSILFQSTLISAKCTCEPQDNKLNDDDETSKHKALLSYKLVAISSILCASALGVILPILLKSFKSSSLQESDYSSLHFLIKAFAAGVILATGFIHILPDAFESLTSPCLSEKLWGGFPFSGFVAMMSAIFTLMMESFATGYHRRTELRKAQPVNIGDDDDDQQENDGRHGQGHGPQILLERSNSSSLIRHRLISQVLELGILVHSVIIGISLGTTENPKTIKPLIIALSFHQFFEGMGLGGCISQAKYKARTITIMVLFFTLTTPTGIAIGMMISKGYNEQSSAALIVQGVLNSASAGILIYMALVDLLATDFMDPKLHSSFKLQVFANVSLVLGASCMSLLAKWGGT